MLETVSVCTCQHATIHRWRWRKSVREMSTRESEGHVKQHIGSAGQDYNIDIAKFGVGEANFADHVQVAGSDSRKTAGRS